MAWRPSLAELASDDRLRVVEVLFSLSQDLLLPKFLQLHLLLKVRRSLDSPVKSIKELFLDTGEGSDIIV